MSRLFDFKKRFGFKIDIEEIKKNFLNLIDYYFIQPLEREDDADTYDYHRDLFDYVAIEFNQNPADLINEYNKKYLYGIYSPDSLSRPPYSIFTKNEFETTLLFIEVMYDYFLKSKNYEKDEWLKRIDLAVKLALRQPISLGVSWRDGKFYPEGAEEFERKLIDEVLKWLKRYPKIQSLYKNALDHYSQSLKDKIKRKDVISNAFQAVEKLTQDYLKSPKPSFDNNFNNLVDKLLIDKEWKRLLNSYKELSKKFGRHTGEGQDFIPNAEDTEAYLYLSGLILRLILQKIEKI